MKHILLSIFAVLLIVSSAVAKEPPGLIYACKTSVNGKPAYFIYNSAGEKILQQPVAWAYSNTWSWLFVYDPVTKLKTVYDYSGAALGIDSIQASQSVYTTLTMGAMMRNGKWGFYNRAGKLRIPHQYDDVSHFNKGKAAVKLGSDIFFIDTNGVRLKEKYIPHSDYSFSDDDIAIGMGGDFYSPDYKKVNENGLTGLLEVRTNKIIIPAIYDALVDPNFRFQLITAGKGGKYGVLSFDGTVIIPLEFEEVFVLNAYF